MLALEPIYDTHQPSFGSINPYILENSIKPFGESLYEFFI